jgi:hypothetical protein
MGRSCFYKNLEKKSTNLMLLWLRNTCFNFLLRIKKKNFNTLQLRDRIHPSLVHLSWGLYSTGKHSLCLTSKLVAQWYVLCSLWLESQVQFRVETVFFSFCPLGKRAKICPAGVSKPRPETSNRTTLTITLEQEYQTLDIQNLFVHYVKHSHP